MLYTTLGKTGLKVSKLGFGCAPLGDAYGGISDEEAIKTVHHAIDRGITLFDTSTYYGPYISEERLGKALKGYRDKVVLATKGGRFGMALETGFDFSYNSIIEMCEASLKRLHTDYLDIYQLHDIEFGKKEQIEQEAIPALYKLKEDGKVRFIGVTGYPLPLLKDIIETHELDLTLSYCHYNLLNQRLNDVLVPSIKDKQMGLINASVTHMGILTKQGGQDWHPAPEAVKEAGRKAAAYCEAQGENLAGLAIQFAFQNEHADATLLGSRTSEELNSSLDILDTPINESLLIEVQSILEPVLNMTWTSGYPEHFEDGAL